MKMRKLAGKTSVILSMGILAISLSAATSFAADKLVVQDATGTTNVFSVDDTGAVTSGPTTVKNHNIIKDDNYCYNSMLSYDDINWGGGFYQAFRARGTEAGPSVVLDNDTVFTFDAKAWDGSAWARGGQIIGKVNGTPAPGIIPFSWSIRTMGGDGVLGDRMTINAGGNITVSDLAGSYSGGSAYVCVNNNGMLYASETACP